MINRIVFWGTLGLILINTSASAQRRQLLDCETGQPVAGVKILDSRNKLMATTDASGNYSIPAVTFPLFMDKGGYNLLQINNVKELNSACLSLHVHQLNEVTVVGSKSDLGDYLLALRDKNVPKFITHDTVLYYIFTYTLDFPINHWKETATGYIAHHWKPHSNIWPVNDYYIQYQYSNSDASFVKNPVYKNSKNLSLGTVILTDVMGNKDGYAQWKKIAKAKRRDHVKLELSKDSNHIFIKSYYDSAEIGFQLNQFEFDTAGNLLSFSAQTLPQYLSAIKLFRHFDPKENERSSYYTKFAYSEKKNEPRVLKTMTHVSSDYNGNLFYKTHYTIELVSEKPKKQFYAPAFALRNGQMILDYFIEHKGKEDKSMNKLKK